MYGYTSGMLHWTHMGIPIYGKHAMFMISRWWRTCARVFCYSNVKLIISTLEGFTWCSGEKLSMYDASFFIDDVVKSCVVNFYVYAVESLCIVLRMLCIKKYASKMTFLWYTWFRCYVINLWCMVFMLCTIFMISIFMLWVVFWC